MLFLIGTKKKQFQCTLRSERKIVLFLKQLLSLKNVQGSLHFGEEEKHFYFFFTIQF